MATRKRPYVVSTRVTHAERALIEAAAEASGVTVCELVWRLVVPRVRDLVVQTAGGDDRCPRPPMPTQ